MQNKKSKKINVSSRKTKKNKYKKAMYKGQELTWSIEYGAWGVFRPYRRDKVTGELIWAKLYGKRAFFIPIYYGPLDEIE